MLKDTIDIITSVVVIWKTMSGCLDIQGLEEGSLPEEERRARTSGSTKDLKLQEEMSGTSSNLQISLVTGLEEGDQAEQSQDDAISHEKVGDANGDCRAEHQILTRGQAEQRKDECSSKSSSSSSITQSTRQPLTIPRAVARYVECPINNNPESKITNYNIGTTFETDEMDQAEQGRPNLIEDMGQAEQKCSKNVEGQAISMEEQQAASSLMEKTTSPEEQSSSLREDPTWERLSRADNMRKVRMERNRLENERRVSTKRNNILETTPEMSFQPRPSTKSRRAPTTMGGRRILRSAEV
jgi:hypothetical protein